MGQTPTPIYDPGIPCIECWGVGKAHGNVDTPIRVQARFENVINCPAIIGDPNPILILPQVAACIWYLLNASYECTYWAENVPGIGDMSRLLLLNVLSLGAWFDSKRAQCQVDFTNDIGVGDCAIGLFEGHGGTGKITWGPEI